MQKLSSVLLVDDDQTNNFLNQRLLSRLGVAEQVLIALNGQQAIDQLLAHCHRASPACPALILLDLKMPVLDGFGFLEAYAQLELPQKEHVIIVMLTTSLHPDDLDRVHRLHIAGFLNKPLTRAKVDHILHAHFQRRLPVE